MCLPDSSCQALFLLGDRDEMDVIRHQTPSQIRNAEPLALLSKIPQVLRPIFVGEEDVHATNTALSDVMGQSGNDDTSKASHAQILS